MPLKHGTHDVLNVKYGSQDVNQVYYAGNLIWERSVLYEVHVPHQTRYTEEFFKKDNTFDNLFTSSFPNIKPNKADVVRFVIAGDFYGPVETRYLGDYTFSNKPKIEFHISTTGRVIGKGGNGSGGNTTATQNYAEAGGPAFLIASPVVVINNYGAICPGGGGVGKALPGGFVVLCGNAGQGHSGLGGVRYREYGGVDGNNSSVNIPGPSYSSSGVTIPSGGTFGQPGGTITASVTKSPPGAGGVQVTYSKNPNGYPLFSGWKNQVTYNNYGIAYGDTGL